MKTRNLLCRLTFSMFIFVVLPSMGEARIHQSELQILLTKTAPVIDGNLNDATWHTSAELQEFVNQSLVSYLEDTVSVFLCYDEKNLYVAFRSADPAVGELNKVVDPKRPRDTLLWGLNNVMVVIGSKDVSVQLMADPKETMTDWKNNDITWNGNWQYAASINLTDWTSNSASH